MRKHIYLPFFLLFCINFYGQTELKLYNELPPPSNDYNNLDEMAYQKVIEGVVTTMVEQDPSIVPRTAKYDSDGRNCGKLGEYFVGHNNDFIVQVKKDEEPLEDFRNLFEFNTFVNSSSGDWSGVTRSSFVTFEYDGKVTIKIKCMQFGKLDKKTIIIRPQSRELDFDIQNGNEIILTLNNTAGNNLKLSEFASDKLSVEINGDRYHNLQIFANRIAKKPNDSFENTYTAEFNGRPENIYYQGLNGNSKKILIKAGAILQVPYDSPVYATDNGTIVLTNGDQIYIEGGGILNGGIFAKGVNDFSVRGNGIIDLTNYPKNYVHNNPNDYAYVQALTFRNCNVFGVEDVILNDSQQLCVELTDCGGYYETPGKIKFNNMKLFSRVLWGDGFHMRGTSNVSIKDCYLRTADDCISIYASRRQTWDLCDDEYRYQLDPLLPNDSVNDYYYDDESEYINGVHPTYPAVVTCEPTGAEPYLNRDSANISVTHTLLYADNAHAIEIGWHGNQRLNNGLNIYNLRFTDIDILEHDTQWIQQNGQVHYEYDGTIGINCSDDNNCIDFLFTRIHVEDFTSGSILSVRVMPFGIGDAKRSGKSVQDIRFQDLDYTGSHQGIGKHSSIIRGVNCERFVNGVHFENFKVRTDKFASYELVENFDQQFDSHRLFDEDDSYAYNVTFQEANNYSENLVKGYYRIKNATSHDYLKKTAVNTNVPTVSSATNQTIWYLKQVVDGDNNLIGHYRIFPASYDSGIYSNDQTIALTKIISPSEQNSCAGRFVNLSATIPVDTNQQWKIKQQPVTTSYTINDAYTRAYLTAFSSGTDVEALPKDVNEDQMWEFELLQADASTRSTNTPIKTETINVFPNPTKDYLNINNLKDIKNAKVEIISLNGTMVISKEIINENSKVGLENIADGIYIIKITNNGDTVYSDKFVKTH